MPNVPELFATALGKRCVGEHRCYYCGSPADETIPTSVHVGAGFTARDACACPGSPWVCIGCGIVHRDAVIPEYADPQRCREFSWIVTSTSATAYLTALTVAVPDALSRAEKSARTDADRDAAKLAKLRHRREQLTSLRNAVLSPPAPPFAIVLTIGGRTHQLYRGIVCHDAARPTLTLEMERITYTPAELAERIDLCKQIIAATGKPRLADPPSASLVCSLQQHYAPGSEIRLISAWEPIWNSPLTRLALFLSPIKEECELEYPKTAVVDAGRLPGGRKTAR